jgi:hypothetical protein
MPVSKGPDCVGDEMRRFKDGELHSGQSKKPVKNKKQAVAIALSVCGKSKYSEMIQGLGFNEHAAQAFAEMYDFISAKEAEENAGDGPLGDIQSTPGKQKGDSGRQKQAPQELATTTPTLPKQAPGNNDYSDGPMVKAKKGTCPTGTRAVGGGHCRNTKPGKRQYFEVEKGKSCPPGSKSAGSGRCRVDFAEYPGSTGAENAKKAIENTSCSKKREKDPNAPKKEVATPTKPTQPTEPEKPKTPEQQMLRDTAKKRAEQCAKQQGN